MKRDGNVAELAVPRCDTLWLKKAILPRVALLSGTYPTTGRMIPYGSGSASVSTKAGPPV
jgi:hypothetical protein